METLRLNKVKLPKMSTDEKGNMWTETSIGVSYRGLYRNIYYRIEGVASPSAVKWGYHAGTRGSGEAISYLDCVNKIKRDIDRSEEAEAEARNLT